MKKVKYAAILSLFIFLLSGIVNAETPYGPPFDDAATYIRALEDAIDARYGSRGAWPRGFATYLAVAKYYSGIEASYKSTLSWAPKKLQALEAKAVSDTAGQAAVCEFLYELNRALEPLDQRGFSWPYEAHALRSAAHIYANDGSSSNHAVLPSENDLPQEEAIAIAKEAIRAEYNISDIGINQHEVYSYYTAVSIYGSPLWVIVIGLNEYGYELYYAYIASPTGEVLVAKRNDGNG